MQHIFRRRLCARASLVASNALRYVEFATLLKRSMSTRPTLLTPPQLPHESIKSQIATPWAQPAAHGLGNTRSKDRK